MLLATAFFSFVQRVEQANDARNVFENARSNVPLPESEDLGIRDEREFPSKEEDASLTYYITLDDFQPRSGQLSGTIGAFHDRIKGEAGSPSGSLSSAPLELVSLSALSTVEVPVAEDQAGVKPVPLKLETWGTARAFPSDAYAANYHWRSNGTSSDVNFIVATGERLSDYRIKAIVGDGHMNFLLERSWPQQGWIYTVALSPLLLMLGFVVASSRPKANPAEVAIEAAVGILALMPLRQVLVPNYIETLNTVDFLLGFEFVLFITWMMYAVTKPARSELLDADAREKAAADAPHVKEALGDSRPLNSSVRPARKSGAPAPGELWKEWSSRLER